MKYERAEELHGILWLTIADNIEKYITDRCCADIYEMKQQAVRDMIGKGVVDEENMEETHPYNLCYACEVVRSFAGEVCIPGVCPIALFNDHSFSCENCPNSYRQLKDDLLEITAEERKALAIQIAGLDWILEEDYIEIMAGFIKP